MLRLKLAMIIVGVLAAAYGYGEYNLAKQSTPDPLQVDLATLEAGQVPDNRHLQVGEHWVIYDELFYTYETKKGRDIDENTKVTESFYPVISTSHPFFEDLRGLAAEHGGLESIPDEVWPQLSGFKLMVRTKRYKNIGSIPEGGWEKAESVHGLVVDHKFDSDEMSVIHSSFPGMNMAAVLVLEEGRKPASTTKSFGFMGGGAGASLLGIASLFMGRRKEPETVVAPTDMNPPGTNPVPPAPQG